MLRKDVDEAISKSSTYQAVERYLKGFGYRFERDFRFQYPSVKAEGWRKPELYAVVVPSRNRKPLLDLEENIRRAERMDSVTLLFQIFVELLQLSTDETASQPNSRPISPTMRAEVRKLDRYLEEYHLLCDNNIQSPQDFASWCQGLDSRIAALEQERYSLRLKLRRAKLPDEASDLKEQAKAITKKLVSLRKQKQVAQRIEQDIPKIKAWIEREREIELNEGRNNKFLRREL